MNNAASQGGCQDFILKIKIQEKMDLAFARCWLIGGILLPMNSFPSDSTEV